MAVSFMLDHADFPPLLNSTVSKSVSFFAFINNLQYHGLFPIKLVLVHLNILLKLVMNLLLVLLAFLLETLL